MSGDERANMNDTIDTRIGPVDHPLEVGEETTVHTPDLSITHHRVRRTEDGYETCSALTDWRSISPKKVAERVYWWLETGEDT